MPHITIQPSDVTVALAGPDFSQWSVLVEDVQVGMPKPFHVARATADRLAVALEYFDGDLARSIAIVIKSFDDEADRPRETASSVTPVVRLADGHPYLNFKRPCHRCLLPSGRVAVGACRSCQGLGWDIFRIECEQCSGRGVAPVDCGACEGAREVECCGDGSLT